MGGERQYLGMSASRLIWRRAGPYWLFRRRGVLFPPPRLGRLDHSVGPAPGERGGPRRPPPRDSGSPPPRESLVAVEATPGPGGSSPSPDPAGVPFALPPVRVQSAGRNT